MQMEEEGRRGLSRAAEEMGEMRKRRRSGRCQGRKSLGCKAEGGIGRVGDVACGRGARMSGLEEAGVIGRG
jgi:hypothetical protein